jgi:hypothetical protein
MGVTRKLSAVLLSMALVAASACGGGGNGDASKKQEGAAALAVAEYFAQEAAGGRLPEGPQVRGSGTAGIKPLAVNSDQKKDSVTARVCVVFGYSISVTPFTSHARVYIATLRKGAWEIEAVKNEGDCGDVA